MKQAGFHAYADGGTRERIEEALRQAGQDPDRLSADALAPIEDFHSLGRIATLGLIELAGVARGDRVLDAGSGIGGAARLLVEQVGCHVTTVDLTSDFCDTARWINHRLDLEDRIDVHQGDVLDLPFDAGGFDVVISQHVQMNVADKRRLYAEAHRVLVPGGRLALWDVTAGSEQPIHFPVPWADVPEHSHLITPEQLSTVLDETGFEVAAWADLTELAVEAMTRFFAAGPAQLGLHVYVPNFAAKASNLIANGRENRIRLIQAVLTTRSGGG